MKPRRGLAASVALPAALLLLAAAPPRRPAQPTPASSLVARAFSDTPLLRDLEELCDRVGGRPTGSPACARAVEWASAKARQAGADAVTVEPFPMPGLWLPGAVEASCQAPERFPLRAVAAPGSPGTPGGQRLEAPLVDAGDGSAGAFARLGDKARGAFALVATPEMKTEADLFGEYARNGALVEAAARAGVAGVLYQSSRPRGLLYRHPITFGGAVAPMPVAMLAREELQRLTRLAESGEVRVSLAMTNTIAAGYDSGNVLAELRGRDKPEEIVLLGAHLDSWELGTGANDNGVNCALVLDVLRGLAQLELRPRRTVRFVLFTGEEQGMWGSAGYVNRHAAEMDRHVAVVVFDVGSGRTSGFYLNGRSELRGAVDAALAGVAGLSPMHHSEEALDGTDNFDFLLAGVPNLVARQDFGPYLPDYHAESDTFDKVDAREARMNEAIAAALVWGLADAAERPGRRQGRAEVERLLSETRLDEQMKALGQWEDWLAGKRGGRKR